MPSSLSPEYTRGLAASQVRTQRLTEAAQSLGRPGEFTQEQEALFVRACLDALRHRGNRATWAFNVERGADGAIRITYSEKHEIAMIRVPRIP